MAKAGFGFLYHKETFDKAFELVELEMEEKDKGKVPKEKLIELLNIIL